MWGVWGVCGGVYVGVCVCGGVYVRVCVCVGVCVYLYHTGCMGAFGNL